MIYRAVDEGKLREENIHLENFSKVIKEVGNQYTKDIIEEELDNMLKVLDKQIKRKYQIYYDLCSSNSIKI